LDFRSPTERLTGNPRRPAGKPACQTTLPLLDFLHPTTQSKAGGYVYQRQIPLPLRGHVRGLDTPFAALTSGPPDAEASERPWVSPFKVFPSPQSVPLSGPIPSCRCLLSRCRPEGWHETTGSASGSCSCDESVLSPESRVIPTVDTFLGFDPPESAPAQPGARFDFASPPLSPSGGLTSRPARASGYCGTCRWVDPSPDRQLSWAFLPSDDLGAPYAVPWGGLIASPHARAAQGSGWRSMPLGNDATTDPGPVARHRRHSVCGR
jgi:hypothetical protein